MVVFVFSFFFMLFLETWVTFEVTDVLPTYFQPNVLCYRVNVWGVRVTS